MAYSIDRLYDMLSWDNEISVQECAIAEAKLIKNLYPFIQPMLAPPKNSKAIWENCAKIIAMRSDEELKFYDYWLFEWLQDINWPGALIILERLSQIPFSELKSAYERSVDLAKKDNDDLWLMALDMFIEKYKE